MANSKPAYEVAVVDGLYVLAVILLALARLDHQGPLVGSFCGDLGRVLVGQE